MKPETETERVYLRLLLGGLVAIVVLGAIGFWGFRFARNWQSGRLTDRAEKFLSVGDTRSATLTAQRILQYDAENLDAFRILARASELNGQRSAIPWRERVASRLPNSVKDQIALAKAALQFGETGVAQLALEHAAKDSAGSAPYHETMAQLAIARKDPAAARSEYAEAARLDPNNKTYQLNVAVFDLQAADPDVRLKASRFLQSLLNDKALRAQAVRALLDYAVQRRDPALIEIAKVEFDYPESSYRERLRCLRIFHELKLPDYASALTRMEDEAAADAAKATDLVAWLTETNQITLAIDWTAHLPESFLQQRPLFVAVADCYVAAKDCAELAQWCKKFGWKDLEFLRHAYLARSLRDCGKPLDSSLEWSKAIQEASGGEDIYVLQRDAVKWGWKEQAIDLLWRLADDREKQRGALAALYEHYSETSDTENLYRVASRLAQIAPDDPIVQNNWAQLSLLLNLDLDNARAAAQRLHERDPKNPAFASTYAYALSTHNRAQEAIHVMESLTEDDLKKPEIAAYYGIVLAAGGQKEKAAKFLEAGRQARLLPQEKALVEKAIAANQRR